MNITYIVVQVTFNLQLSEKGDKKHKRLQNKNQKLPIRVLQCREDWNGVGLDLDGLEETYYLLHL